eukprot:TRINITY_DN5733_c0_g2_i1.p1 TRINITY_DN5733_c0_g2~~TRINITY_DN5733_c0_g2_i1.p1  ORF type:complete len:2172 (+),score=326.12 TRINITY_DN5733_c0_g2_i1:124-6639(+)
MRAALRGALRLHAPGCAVILLQLLLCFDAPVAALLPTLDNCSLVAAGFNVGGTHRAEMPCDTQAPGYGVFSVHYSAGNYFFTCVGGGAFLCDGDGRGPNAANCSELGTLGCLSTVHGLALTTTQAVLYAACNNNQLTRCEWNSVTGTASGCAVVVNSVCPNYALAKSLDLADDSTLVVGCWARDVAEVNDGRMKVCLLNESGGAAVLPGGCQSLGEPPCADIEGTAQQWAVSLDDSGGVSVGCNARKGIIGSAAYCQFSLTTGAMNCISIVTTTTRTPCTSVTYGVAHLPTGIGVSCGPYGFWFCPMSSVQPLSSMPTQPSSTHCAKVEGAFEIGGTARDRPCNNNYCSVNTVNSADDKFLFGTADGVALCDGDGSGRSPVACHQLWQLGCPGTSVYNPTLNAAGDALWVSCGYNQIRRCTWDPVALQASACAEVRGVACAGQGTMTGIALTSNHLVFACMSQASIKERSLESGVFICPLTPDGAAVQGGACQESGGEPCLTNGGRSRGLSLDRYGGITIGCLKNQDDNTKPHYYRPFAMYCKFSIAGGVHNCTTRRCACEDYCTGWTLLPSGRTGFACANGGYWLCTPPGLPTLPPTPGAPPSGEPSAPPTAEQFPSKAPTAAPTRSPLPGHHTYAPSTSPSLSPSDSPSLAPSTSPSHSPSAAPTLAPTVSPTAPPSLAPSVPPSSAPSVRPSSAPSARPSVPPTPAPSSAPTVPPTAQPTLHPSVPPSISPSYRPSSAPSAHPSSPPTPAPSSGPTVPPTGSPSQPPTTVSPTQSPSASPSEFRSPHPTASPTRAPSRSPSPPPQPTAAPKCASNEYWTPAGGCSECSAEQVQEGCPPGGGGFPAPSANGSLCLCSCRFYWQGPDCTVCPPGFGGLDCDVCAVGGAEPPQCDPPYCAAPDSLPGDIITECGAGVTEVTLRPNVHHKGVPVAVTIAATSPVGPPQLELPSHVPAQQVAGGGLVVEGAEAQLSAWLQLRIVPAEALTHKGSITVNVSISGDGCVPVGVQFALRCPAPAPRVSGALPAAAVPHGDDVDIPCPLAELAQIDKPFSVESDPPGVVTFNSQADICAVHSSALPPEGGTTVVILVKDPSGAEVQLPLRIDITPPICGSGVRHPLYVQVPFNGKVGAIATDRLRGSFTGFQLIGKSRGIEVNNQGGTLRITASPEAAEETFYVRLRHSVSGEECAESQPVHTFWGPSFLGPTERVRQPVGHPFEHVLAIRVLASVGAPPWCPEPVLRLARQPGGLELFARKTGWVLRGVLATAGSEMAYVSATDCRGGSATTTVELYGVTGTELGPPPAAAYLEDMPIRLPLPSVLSTAKQLTLSVAPQLDVQLRLGVLRASCPAEVKVAQEEPSLALELTGPPARLAECEVTLTPVANGCDTLRLLWRADGSAVEQLLPGICSPDTPVATPLRREARWGEHVRASFSDLAHSVDHDHCLRFTSAANSTKAWLKPSGTEVAGYTPRREETQCQPVNVYTCQTNMGVLSKFCVTSLPDARVLLPSQPIPCVEDTPCRMYGNVTVEGTNVSRDDTMLALHFSSQPPVLETIGFGGDFGGNNTEAPPEVRQSERGALRVEGTLETLRFHFPEIQFGVTDDWDDYVNITVRGAGTTAIEQLPPFAVFFAPVNDAPRCNDSCEKFEITCGLTEGEKIDMYQHFWDPDNSTFGFGANSTSFGVSVSGNVLTCSSIIALLVFYGLPYTGSAKVFAVDASGLQSPAREVDVAYELTYTETVIATGITIFFSVYGLFFLLVRPGVVAAVRHLRRRAAGDSPPDGTLFCRVGKRAAEQLRAAQEAVVTAGCGLLWFRVETTALAAAAEKVNSGEAAVIDCGEALELGVQGESARDAGTPMLSAVLCPKALALEKGAAVPALSVLHADPKEPLSLCLRLRGGDAPAGSIVWVAGLSRLLALCRPSGVAQVEYKGTARQLTEWAHMQRIVGPAGLKTELVWTLSEGQGGREILGGAIPVGTAGASIICGAEDAGSPRLGAAGPAGTTGTPAEPLLSRVSTLQPQQVQRPSLNSLCRSAPPRSPTSDVELQEMQQRMQAAVERRLQESFERRLQESQQKHAAELQAARMAAASAHHSATQVAGVLSPQASGLLSPLSPQRSSGGPRLGPAPPLLGPRPPPPPQPPPGRSSLLSGAPHSPPSSGPGTALGPVLYPCGDAE